MFEACVLQSTSGEMARACAVDGYLYPVTWGESVDLHGTSAVDWEVFPF